MTGLPEGRNQAAGFKHWALLPLRRYAQFSGRSCRREFWAFQLLVLAAILLAVFAMFAFDPLASVQSEERFPVWAGYAILPLLVPLIAVTIRRLHDLNLAGWWLIPLILAQAVPAIDSLAALAYVVIMAWPGSRSANRFGDSLRLPAAENAVRQ